jgi:UDP-4-amino-4,6-dideoxy-N-acetyl-beta-L-altrosamine transaminase
LIKVIPYGRQEITADDIQAVKSVLESDYLTQGPAVPAFERKVADRCGATHAVAVNSATSALHIACLALGLSPGDVLWTSPITFVASANCALYCGASVDFVDIDPKTYNLSTDCLEEKLKAARISGKIPKIVIPVHLCGQPCEMQRIWELSQEYGFRIIEDASHAIGAKYLGDPVGNCRFSDITVFSFHPVKIITTGEGGMAMTNDDELALKINLFRSHGITRDPTLMTQTPDGPWYYQQIELGFNYRITDIQAALGISQMDRLDVYVSRRHELANRYQHLLVDLPVNSQIQPHHAYSAYHLYVIRLQLHKIKRTHREIFDSLRAQGIGVNLHYIPVHTQPYYLKMGFNQGDFPEAERYYAEAISLPMYPSISDEELGKVITSLKEYLTKS